MGDSPPSAACKRFPKVSPHGGLGRHQAVVFRRSGKEHEQVGDGEQSVSKGMLYDRGVALIVNARGIWIFFVEFPAELGGELFAGMVAVRADIAEFCKAFVKKRGDKAVDAIRKPVQEIEKLRAPVRRGNGSESSHMLCHAKAADQISGIQSSLGVGDDVYLVTMVFHKDLFQFFLYDQGVILNGSPGLLMAVVDNGAVLCKLLRDPAPVIKVTQVAEPDAVEQKKGVTGGTGQRAVPAASIFETAHLLVEFFPGLLAHIFQKKQVKEGNPESKENKNAFGNSQPPAGEKNPDTPV